METKTNEGRTVVIDRITGQLATFVTQVEIAVKNNLANINVISETIMAGVLNRMYQWNLENANSEKQNFPGVDLVDEDACIAVQVTSTNSVKKVNHTIEKFTEHHLGERFSRLIVLVITNEKPTEGMKRRKLDPWFSGEKDIWNIPTLLQKMMSLDVGVLEDITKYLFRELGVFAQPAVRKPKHQLPGVPSPSASFIAGSRDKELAELKEMLSPDAPIFLWGVGGIGKTEVAIQLARNFAPAEGAYFLHYYDMPGEGEALRETILRANFTDYTYNKPDTDNRDQEYKERMDILRTEYPGALLVIDNFDRPGKTLAELQAEKAYQELTAMGIQLVFTTRSPVKKQGYEIVPLDEKFLLTLMRDNLDGVDVSDDDMHRLIEAVDGHTLMVVLMARTLAKSYGNLKPSDILAALQESRMNTTSFRKVDNEHNPANPQARIYDHMKALFWLSDMNDVEKEVLRWATLLPEDGMDAGLFQSCLKENRLDDIPEELMALALRTAREKYGDEAGSDEELRQLFGEAISEMQAAGDDRQDTMNSLIDRGWLALGAKNLLTIHPVVREVCWEELKPTDANCGAFLDRLWNRYSLRKEYYADKFTQIAKCLSMASDKLADGNGVFALRAGMFWDELGQARTALRYELQMVERLEKNPDADSKALDIAYNNVGTTYIALGDYRKALEYQLKDLAICEKVRSPEDPSLAISFGNVGSTYGALGDHRKALEYQMKALAIQEKVLPPEHPDLATSYNNVGATYSDLGDHNKALEYMLKALAIREKLLPPDHPDLAASYNNVGTTYGALGNHQKALEYKLKDLAICEKVLPPDHPDLATSYNNVGTTYSALGNHQKALEYKLKDLAICEKVLPLRHPSLAISYGNVGSTYGALGEYEKQLEYEKKTLRIFEQVLPKDHPHLGQAYNNIGITYSNLEQFSRAAEYLEKALAILKKSLPENHPYIASAEENLRYIQLMAMLQEAGISLDDLMKGEA